MRNFFMFIALIMSISSYSQQLYSIGEVKNEIILGPLAGNRDLAFGVKFILEEVLQDEGFDLAPNSQNIVEVSLKYFDVKKTSMQVGFYNKTTDATEIIAEAKLVVDGKVKKTVVAKGVAKDISTATLIIDKGGKFSQAGVSTALKKVCIQLIEKLKL